MFYVIDTHGDTKAVLSEPIYQGSIGVNDIVLLAPFPQNAQVSVNAILPNGLITKNPTILSAVPLPQGLPQFFDAQGNRYTAFSGVIDESLTSYAGIVQIQFKVILGIGKVLGTYKTSFNVGEGVVTEPISLPTDEDYYNKILQYLAELNSDPLKSVIYSAPNDTILPTSIGSTNPNISTAPEDTTAYIGEEGNYIDVTGSFGISVGLTFNYAEAKHIQLLQFWMLSATKTININIAASYNNTVVTRQTIVISPTTQPIAINPRVYLGSKLINKISISIITDDERIVVKGIQAFLQNIDGQYIFTLKSGVTAVINAPDGASIESYYTRAQESANNAELSAQNAAVSATGASNSADRAESAQESAQSSSGQALTYAEQAGASANSASTSALSAQASATEANNALQTILGRRKVYYESNLALAIGMLSYGQYENGDMIVIGVKNVPDLFIFNLSTTDGAYALDGATPINSGESEEYYKNTITAGGKYTVNGTDYGVIAIESGIDTSNFITFEEFSTALSSLDDVKQNKLTTTPSTVIGVNSTGEIVNYKIAQAVPWEESDGNSIVNTEILSQALGSVETALENIIKLQNSYINGGVTQ